jgi:hypothetical protein
MTGPHIVEARLAVLLRRHETAKIEMPGSDDPQTYVVR